MLFTLSVINKQIQYFSYTNCVCVCEKNRKYRRCDTKKVINKDRKGRTITTKNQREQTRKIKDNQQGSIKYGNKLKYSACIHVAVIKTKKSIL
jgi:hypothetical protein